jgi:hypothetical protein
MRTGKEKKVGEKGVKEEKEHVEGGWREDW